MIVVVVSETKDVRPRFSAPAEEEAVQLNSFLVERTCSLSLPRHLLSSFLPSRDLPGHPSKSCVDLHCLRTHTMSDFESELLGLAEDDPRKSSKKRKTKSQA